MNSNFNSKTLAKQLVCVSDFAIANIMLIAVSTLFADNVPYDFRHSFKVIFLLTNVSMAFAQYFFHTIVHYRWVEFNKIAIRVLQLTGAHVVSLFILMSFMFPKVNFFHLAIPYAVFCFIAIMVSRFFERFILKFLRLKGHNVHNIIFIGNDPSLLDLYRDMKEDTTMGYRILGFYADHDFLRAPKELKRLGTLDDWKQHKTQDVLPKAQEVFCSLSHDYNDFMVDVMKFCDANVLRFHYIPRKFSPYRLPLRAEYMGDTLLYTNHVDPLSYANNRILKRLFDIIGASIACLFLLLITPIIAICIKMQSPGPIFFKQQRTGFAGKPFTCYKFRSMHVNTTADTEQATKDDPRKFAFGNFMRRTNIDELPQFWNVLKGDMSIVGPRPHMLYHTQVYSDLIDKYMVRHFCKPGITGWAQVTGYRGETTELWQMEERVEHDIWYIEHWSFALDLRIILRTISSMFIPDKHAY